MSSPCSCQTAPKMLLPTLTHDGLSLSILLSIWRSPSVALASQSWSHDFSHPQVSKSNSGTVISAQFSSRCVRKFRDWINCGRIDSWQDWKVISGSKSERFVSEAEWSLSLSYPSCVFMRPLTFKSHLKPTWSMLCCWPIWSILFFPNKVAKFFLPYSWPRAPSSARISFIIHTESPAPKKTWTPEI